MQLRGKNMAVLSCGSDSEIFDGFEMPFEQSAIYLGMHYKGHVHTWIEPDGLISDDVKKKIDKFGNKL